MNITMLAQSDSFWMPVRASSYAGDVDRVFYFILGVATFFFTLITVLMILFVVRYRRRAGQAAEASPNHSFKLELTWTIIPVIIVIAIFIMGFRGFMNMTTEPANSYEIVVTAYKWAWAFTYPNGYVDSNLHVPANRPIKLVLTSQDVIHSLFVPAFRIKKDAVPGRYNRTWFEATEVNTDPGYDLLCAEYCGTSHSAMIAKVFVHDPSEFNSWLEQASQWEGRMTPLQRGAQLYSQRGCTQCHSTDGHAVIGPTFKNLWDRTVEGTTAFTDGRKLSQLLGPDYGAEDYIRESLYKPDNHTVAGYTPAMPSYEGQIKENDLPAMIAYLKSLSDKYKHEAEQTVASKPEGGG